MTASLLRPATAADMPSILRLVHALADYENLPVAAAEDDLRRALFADPPHLHAVLAEPAGPGAGTAIGLAIWFTTFSTFAGRANLYVEDVFVDPAHRGTGIGRALFRYLARLTIEQKYGRMEWSVLNHNEPARRFYQSIGAVPVTEWTVQRLSGAALAALAASEDTSHG